MRVDRNLLGWGVFLILLGGIPLAVDQGWIPADLQWWLLWPLILIGIGVSVILRGTALAAIGNVLVGATFGIMLGGVLANGLGGWPVINVGCGGSNYGTAFAAQSGQLSGQVADVRLEMGCGDLSVTTTAGTQWQLTGTSAGGTVPEVQRSDTSLTVRLPNADEFAAFFRDKSRWNVTLPTSPRLALSATVNAGSGKLDLAGATADRLSVTLNAGDTSVDMEQAVVDRISLTVNAGSAKIQLPDGSMDGSMTVNAGSIAMCAPSDVALRLNTGDNITGSYDYAKAGLVQVADHVWQSPDWASATKRITLSTSANAGSVSLDPEGGCR